MLYDKCNMPNLTLWSGIGDTAFVTGRITGYLQHSDWHATRLLFCERWLVLFQSRLVLPSWGNLILVTCGTDSVSARSFTSTSAYTNHSQSPRMLQYTTWSDKKLRNRYLVLRQTRIKVLTSCFTVSYKCWDPQRGTIKGNSGRFVLWEILQAHQDMALVWKQHPQIAYYLPCFITGLYPCLYPLNINRW